MDLIYFIAYYFPFWAIPLGVVVLELGLLHRKRGHFLKMLQMMSLAAILMVLAGLFFWFDGFNTILPTIKKFETKYLS